jgi:DNA-binding transcriptional LysR family regulator
MKALPQLQALRCFVTVAREGTVSGAAAKLHLSQPAVSLQLKSLEQATGLTLFTRTPHGLVPTREGTALLSHADNALGAMAGFARAAVALQGSVRETLRIGTILDPDFTRLGAFLKELVEAAPHIETQLRHGMSDDVLAQVARRELDVGFYLDSPRNHTPASKPSEDARGAASFQFRVLMEFTYRVVAPPGWGPRVLGRDWKSLGALPWLATPPASAHRRLLAGVFGPLGIELKRVAMTDQEAAMLDLVESGVGLSLVRDTVAKREARARHLVIADKVSIACVLSFVCLRARLAEAAIAHSWSAIGKAWRIRT